MPEMKETVILENVDGSRVLGHADIYVNPDSHPQRIMVTMEQPTVFEFDRETTGGLYYRCVYIMRANNFRRKLRAA